MISKIQVEEVMKELKEKLEEKGYKVEYRYERGEAFILISLRKIEKEIKEIFRKHGVTRVKIIIDKGFLVIKV